MVNGPGATRTAVTMEVMERYSGGVSRRGALKVFGGWVLGLGLLAPGLLAASGCATLPGTLRHRIVTGLEDQGSNTDIVSDRATDLIPVDLSVLVNWQLVDVRNNEMSHPYRLHLAVTTEDEARVVVLSSFPERWPQILEGARVADADQALAVARTHFDVTRTMGKWCTRLESFDDIDFFSGADPDRVAALREQFADRISAPVPKAASSTPDRDGWTMTVWAQENDTELVERRTVVGADAGVTVDRTVHVDDLPVPISI